MSALPWWYSGTGSVPWTRNDSNTEEWVKYHKRQCPGVKLKITKFDGDNNCHFWFSVPDHGINRWADHADAMGMSLQWKPSTWGSSFVDGDALARDVWARAHAKGELRSPDFALNAYQSPRVGAAIQRPGHIFWWRPGSGKTRSAFVFGLAFNQPIVFVSTVGALSTIDTELHTLSGIETYVWTPPSRRRKKWKPLSVYLKECKARGQRPVVLAGYENLIDYVADNGDIRPGAGRDILADMQSFTLILDEIHEAKSHSRWEAVISEMGQLSFEAKNNTTAWCMKLRDRAAQRLGTSGTNEPDRMRDLWAIYDLVDPWSFGGFYSYAARYCNGQPGAFGGYDSSGCSHKEELRDRMEFNTTWVTTKEVAAFMPKIIETQHFLRTEDLCKPEEGWKTQLKQSARKGEDEFAMAQACVAASQKRRWLVHQIVQRLKNGDKVLVFGGFRRDVEKLADAVAKAHGVPDTALIQWAHGDLEAGPGGERMQRVDAYRSWKGPALLVGTPESVGQSLNLQCTDLLIWAALPVEPVKLIQGNGRVERLGRIEPVEIWYVIAEGTVDPRISTLLLDKLPSVAYMSKEGSLDATAKTIAGTTNPEQLLLDIIAGMPGDGSEWRIDEDDDD